MIMLTIMMMIIVMMTMEIKIRRVAKECLLLMMLALMMAMVVNISRAARNNPHPVFDDAFKDVERSDRIAKASVGIR